MPPTPLCRAGSAGWRESKSRPPVTMMLLAIAAAAGVGFFAKRFGRRESVLCVLIACTLTAIYFFRPMTMT